jgi:hypothetical protein
MLQGRDSSVGIEIRLRAGRSGFNSREGLGIFLFATASRPAVQPTQPPYPMGTVGSFRGSKAAGA